MGTIPEEEFEQIRQTIQRGQLTGGERFVEEIEVKVGTEVYAGIIGERNRTGDMAVNITKEKKRKKVILKCRSL